MKFKNKRTGVILDSHCLIKGGDWVKLDQPQEQPKETPKPKRRKQKGE